MKKTIFLVSLFFLASCHKPGDYDAEKVVLAFKNHSFSVFDDAAVRKAAAGGIDELKKLDKNAEIINREGRTVERKNAAKVKLLYPAVFIKSGGGVRAAKVFDYSIASESGFVSGLEVLSADGISEKEIYQDPGLLVSMLENKPAVELEYKNQAGESKRIILKRELAALPSVWSYELGGGSAYVKIMTLSSGLSSYLKNNLTNLKNRKNFRIMLDLRNISAGDYKEVASVVNLFCPKGEKLYGIKSSKPGYSREFTAEKEPVFTGLKIYALTDTTTSGLGEILAQSLREKAGAVLVGEKTAGSFYITRIFKVGENAGLRLSVAKLCPPSGEKNPEEGFAPDFEVKGDAVSGNSALMSINYFADTDPALMKALEVSLGKR